MSSFFSAAYLYDEVWHHSFFIRLEGGGGELVGWDLRVGHAKKCSFKGRARQKNIGCKGGITKRILSSFAVTASVMIDRELNNGIENVTQKVNSRCFKLHRSYCNSFIFSNVSRTVSKFTKRKSLPCVPILRKT